MSEMWGILSFTAAQLSINYVSELFEGHRMKCDCQETVGGKLAKVCTIHQAFVDAATKEAAAQVWSGAIHISAEVQDLVTDIFSEKHKVAANIGVRLYRDALQKRTKA